MNITRWHICMYMYLAIRQENRIVETAILNNKCDNDGSTDYKKINV
jgi:hypothetical protein